MSASKVWSRRAEAVEKSLVMQKSPLPIPPPPTQLEALREDGDTFVFDAFTVDDAWILGNLLRSRLVPFPTSTVISISLANNGQTLFQCVTGSGVMPDNEIWVQRKRNTVLRWGSSTWYQHCKYGGDETYFKAKFGMSDEQASKYSIHGGAIPIRVRGVEGVVAVVVVSGLKQHEDHGVIVDVVKANWE